MKTPHEDVYPPEEHRRRIEQQNAAMPKPIRDVMVGGERRRVTRGREYTFTRYGKRREDVINIDPGAGNDFEILGVTPTGETRHGLNEYAVKVRIFKVGG